LIVGAVTFLTYFKSVDYHLPHLLPSLPAERLPFPLALCGSRPLFSSHTHRWPRPSLLISFLCRSLLPSFTASSNPQPTRGPSSTRSADLLLLLRPKDILKRRPSLLTATSHRRSQCSSSRGGAPHLSAPSPPSSALLLLPQPLLPQLPPTATLNLLIIVSCDALLLCTKVLISRGRPSTPSGRSPCFTASPLPPTAAPKLDSGGAPGGDRGLPRRPLQGSSTQISHLSTMAALMPFTVCCPPLLPYFLRQSATRLRSARRGDLYFFFLLQSCTWLEQISPVVRSPLLPSTAPHPTVPCDGGFFLRRPSPTPLLLLCRCPLTPSSAPAILNRRRGALPCQMTVLSVREISFLRCQMAANPTAPGCMP
ncbi:hypothetical protein BHE74_00044292, partial [Ensete ventricosum]